MVPLRTVVEAMGGTVTWDSMTSTAIITSDTLQNTTSNIIGNDIERLKMYTRISDYYLSLYLMGDILSDYSNEAGLAEIHLICTPKSISYNQLTAKLQKARSSLQQNIAVADELRIESAKLGIVFYDNGTITDTYMQAIDQYKTSLEYLEKFEAYHLEKDYQNYIKIKINANNLVTSGKKMSMDEHLWYNNLVLNY